MHERLRRSRGSVGPGCTGARATSISSSLRFAPAPPRSHLCAHAAPRSVAFTSALSRAQNTLAIILKEIGQEDISITRDQALNERDYGELTGLNKDDARKKFGEEQVRPLRAHSPDLFAAALTCVSLSLQVHIWRRSYDVPPPGGESLELTAKRVLPYWEANIRPLLLEGKNVLIAA